MQEDQKFKALEDKEQDPVSKQQEQNNDYEE